MTAFVVAHPFVCTVGVSLAGFGVAAWILRFEFRAQMRARRRGGFLVGGDS